MLKVFLLFIFFVMVMSYAKSDVKVNFINLNNFTQSEKDKIQKTASVIEKVINSQEFKYRVLNHVYDSKHQFVDTFLSNENVYKKIMLGAELYKTEENGNIDISLTMYKSPASTIGYTYPDSDTVWLNRKFHNGFDEYDQPSNIVHEWTHKLGFSHAMKWSKPRDYTVPYGVGSIVEELSAMLKANPKALTYEVTTVEPVKPEPVKPIEVPELKTVCARSWKTLWLVKKCWKE